MAAAEVAANPYLAMTILYSLSLRGHLCPKQSLSPSLRAFPSLFFVIASGAKQSILKNPATKPEHQNIVQIKMDCFAAFGEAIHFYLDNILMKAPKSLWK